MPSEVHALQREFPHLRLTYGAALHLHPLVLKLLREKIIEAEARSRQLVKRSNTCLVLVGRGTTDPDANSDVSKLARMLEEGMGFGASFVCYSGTAKPLVPDGLKLAARLGFPRIVVAPFLLFTGVLVKRIYGAAEDLAMRHPGPRGAQGRLSWHSRARRRCVPRTGGRKHRGKGGHELQPLQVSRSDRGI